VRLSVFALQTPVTFVQAQQICQKCADGQLVHGDESAILTDFLPTWLDVVQNSNESTWHDIINYQNESPVCIPTYVIYIINLPHSSICVLVFNLAAICKIVKMMKI